jgi:hypothetical protein
MPGSQTGFPGRVLLGLPVPGGGDAGFVAKVNATEDGYELDDPNSLVSPPSVTVSTEASAFSVTDTHLGGNQIVLANFGSAADITVPPSLTGTEPLIVAAYGAGAVSFVAGSGVTIRSADGNLSLRTQYSAATLIPIAADDYLLVGDLDT